MYLRASKYIGGWEHSGEDKERFKAVLAAAGLPESVATQDSPSLAVRVTVCYWRKANAIHKWLVDTVQEGKDECQESCVSREQLGELVALCDSAIATKNAALLPPESGFFFGSTDVDEGYWEDLRHTAESVRALLDNPDLKDCAFYYQASW